MGLGRPVLAVFFGGLLAGLIDIAAASLIYGLSPIAVLQSVASGFLGPAALSGGWYSAGIGAACHFFIAFAAAAVYVAASRALPVLNRHAVLFGLAYGVAIYVVMTFIVIPLSLAAPQPLGWQAVAWSLLDHMVGIALPISLSAKYFAGPRRVFG